MKTIKKNEFACTRSAGADNNWPRVPRFGDYFQLAIASMSFPFCCCLFSLYVKLKRNGKETRALETTQMHCGEQNWVLGNEIVKDFFFNFFLYSIEVFEWENIFISASLEKQTVSSFPNLSRGACFYICECNLHAKWKGRRSPVAEFRANSFREKLFWI